MQIFHLNLFFAGQDFSTPYMADDLDRYIDRFIISVYREIFSLVLFSSISPSLSGDKLKTGRIPISQTIFLYSQLSG